MAMLKSHIKMRNGNVNMVILKKKGGGGKSHTAS